MEDMFACRQKETQCLWKIEPKESRHRANKWALKWNPEVLHKSQSSRGGEAANPNRDVKYEACFLSFHPRMDLSVIHVYVFSTSYVGR